MSNTGDTPFHRELGTGEHTYNFRCFDTIGRLICCYCGALAYPKDLVSQGLEDIKAGRIHRLMKDKEGEARIISEDGLSGVATGANKPADKPPLLSPDEINRLQIDYKLKYRTFREYTRAVAQAQREIDIKFYTR